ncbi:MAG: hypothetical protein ACE5G2_06550 [Candidatus Krumholzibacteriia bacterium]
MRLILILAGAASLHMTAMPLEERSMARGEATNPHDLRHITAVHLGVGAADPDTSRATGRAAGGELEANAALLDQLAAYDDSLSRLQTLPVPPAAADRRVLEQLVAASRELYEFGDLEAACILIQDALAFARQRVP